MRNCIICCCSASIHLTVMLFVTPLISSWFRILATKITYSSCGQWFFCFALLLITVKMWHSANNYSPVYQLTFRKSSFFFLLTSKDLKGSTRSLSLVLFPGQKSCSSLHDNNIFNLFASFFSSVGLVFVSLILVALWALECWWKIETVISQFKANIIVRGWWIKVGDSQEQTPTRPCSLGLQEGTL